MKYFFTLNSLSLILGLESIKLLAWSAQHNPQNTKPTPTLTSLPQRKLLTVIFEIKLSRCRDRLGGSHYLLIIAWHQLQPQHKIHQVIYSLLNTVRNSKPHGLLVLNLFRLKCVNPHPRPGPRFRLLCLDKKFPPPYVSWLQERVTTAQDFKCISHVYLSVFVYLRLWQWTMLRHQKILV